MKKTAHQAEASLKRLLEIIQKLRSKDGCLWDRKQKKEDMAKYILEETYELIDAINGGSPEALKEEMGDLLFQVFFLANHADECSVLLLVVFGPDHGCVEFRFNFEEFIEIHVQNEQLLVEVGVTY